MRSSHLHAGVAALLSCGLATAEDPTPLYDLSKVEGMQSFVGSESARQLLAKNGFVVTDQQFLQIFSAYISGNKALPKFITTDSAWHTYHVLLEEGMRNLAEGDAIRLKQFSAALLTLALALNGEAKAGPYLDMACFAGVGLALQDADSVKTLDARIKPDVESILSNLKGTGTEAVIPAFGLPFPLTSLRAAGFYVRSPELMGYFAARQWYAVSDFRLKSREETERAFRLALLVDGTPELKKLYADLSDPHDKLVGPCEDADVRAYASIAAKVLGEHPKTDNIPTRLDALIAEASKLPDPVVNDQLLDPDQYARLVQEAKGFRLFPPRRLPCTVTFQNTVDPLVKGRMFPSGVDLLAVGPLASEAGRRVVKAFAKDAAEANAILEAKTVPAPDSLHGQALKLLAELQKPLPPSAPAPLRTPAWQDKQLWTQLGAWAGERHTWTLQTKMTVHYKGLTLDEPPGMVSPYPEFFTDLGRLARSTGGCLLSIPRQPLLDKNALRKSVNEGYQLALKHPPVNNKPPPENRITPDNEAKLKHFMWLLDKYIEHRRRVKNQEERNLLAIQLLTEWIDKKGPSEDFMLFVFNWPPPAINTSGHLKEFADLCDRLATIAHKHVSGQKPDEKDAQFIAGYGMELGRFHFYDGNSWLSPRDDFPIIAPVFVSPINDTILYAGLARPEALYVIAEFEGKPVLHRGAVLSYREFRRPMSQALDDSTWKEEVTKGKIPPPPAFTASFRQ